MSTHRDVIKARFVVATVERDAAKENLEQAQKRVLVADREFDAAYDAHERIYRTDALSESCTHRASIHG